VKEPTTFNEAWNCEDSVNRDKWRIAIKKEFNDLENRKVGDVNSKEICIRTGDALSANGSLGLSKTELSDQLVACSYSQVLCVDFNESSALVINDVSFLVMLVAIIDVETAFLHGNQHIEVYMNISVGTNTKESNC
jgi:hypothetical protein